MESLPARYETNTSVNERFIAFLDREYAPRDPRRWYLMAALTLGSALLTGLVIFFLVQGVTAVWPLIPFGLALVVRGIIGLRRVQRTQVRFHHLRRVVQNGVPVTGYVVQAHAALLQPGDQTLPCMVLFSFQPEVDSDREYMRYLADRIYSMKGKFTDDTDRGFLAGLTSEDVAVPYRRRRLPNSFTDGSTIYCADLWVKQSYLNDNCLRTNSLPCLAEMGEYGGIELVPGWLISPAEKLRQADATVHRPTSINPDTR
ncbi:MAG: hypothetical protein SFU56_16820 [Capsulimonadales bacterium]|nr:hypothetical protein [Capsulimonadales bacterium]